MPASLLTHVALLRGVNVGGRGRVAMADLRALAAGLGLAGAQTLLQSGNLLFASADRTNAALEGALQTAVRTHLGVDAAVFVRTATQWRQVVARNPFPDEAAQDPGHLLVMALEHAPTPDAVRRLRDAIPGRERVHADGPHLYLTYPDGIGRSRLTGTTIERALETRGTARNWNTVSKVAELLGGSTPAT